MSEPSSKLDMNSLKEALDVSGETTEAKTEQGAEQDLAQETMRKSNTLTVDGQGETGKGSPETLSPGGSPAISSPQPTPVGKAAETETPSADSNSSVTAQPAAPRPRSNDEGPPSAQLDATSSQIKSMFPDIDGDTIQAVVVAEGGDFERAINTLLQMSDPSYVPPPPERPSSQTEADEQLARSLAADEENRARAQSQQSFVPPSGRGGSGLGSFFNGLTGQGQQAQQQQPASAPSYDPNNLTYQPRVRRTPSSQAAGQGHPQQSYPQYQSPPPRTSPQPYHEGGSGHTVWPGPKEAKQWQEDINKFAETGLAKAASTFSALRQRGEQAWANRASANEGSEGRNDHYGGNGGGSTTAASGQRGGSFFSGWNGPRGAPAASAGQSTISPTIGSHRGFDRDPSPVGDNELAKILARGRNSNDGLDYNGGGAPQRSTSGASSIGDRHKKAFAGNRSGSRQGKNDEYDEDDAALGWDDAGRTSAAKSGPADASSKSFEPIKLSDNSADLSSSGDAGGATPVSTDASTKTGQRNAVSLMEASAGRGVTSPRVSSGPANEKGAAGAHSSGAADDDDDDDLEYVANPFEDED